MSLVLASILFASAARAASLPELSVATPASRQVCETLLADFIFLNTVLETASVVPASNSDPEYCIIKGEMNDRVGPVDGADYGSKFEIRLPGNWNGRFLYQANGGIDGNVAMAVGSIGAPPESALQKGFAVISSDAGHPTRSASFGIDPEARLDYGYKAVGYLTPMAKALIKAAYGKEPDRSYIGGGSNGGRHVMVAAARYGEEYDGYYAIAPGFRLPKAGVHQMWSVQQWATIATEHGTPTDPDTGLATALTGAERQVVADAILSNCDALDGLEDGMVLDTVACQDAFSVVRHVPVCPDERDGTCLTNAQAAVVSRIFAGGITPEGRDIYSDWYYDPGLRVQNWADWKFKFSTDNRRTAVAMSNIFMTPPQPISTDLESTYAFVINQDVDDALDAIYFSNDTYTESSWEFMTPPEETNLDLIRDRGAKLLVMHGVSDPIFSARDTVAWYEELDAAYSGNAEEFARLFLVPGMTHVAQGPSTDQFDGLGALVDWVEQGIAPDSIEAKVRSDNADIPESWSADRSRPLCLYPLKAVYIGGEDGFKESAVSFECK